jgi:hypothetical protein
LKGEKQVTVRKEIGIPDSIVKLAKLKGIKLNDSRDSKGWFNIAEKKYPMNEIDDLEKIGQVVLDRLKDDWVEFSLLIEQVYIR